MDQGKTPVPLLFPCSAEYKFADAANGKRARNPVSLRHTSILRRRAWSTLAALPLLMVSSVEAAEVTVSARKVAEAGSLGATQSHLDNSAPSTEAAAVASNHFDAVRKSMGEPQGAACGGYGSLGLPHDGSRKTVALSSPRAGIGSAGHGPPYLELKETGGRFGFDADWQFGVQEGDGDEDRGWDGVRGESCMAEDKRREVEEILSKRRVPPGSQKVAACLRTKDYGRYLPEWLAFHYSIGVDEVSIYDDDSLDGTLDILRPFIEEGLVRYVFHEIDGLVHEMEPLNLCLNHYLERREEDPEKAPQWLLFHDTDEYIYPVDTSLTLLEGLQRHSSTCCVQVPRIKFGSGGYSETPRGLLIDNFITHQNFTSHQAIQKVMVNLEPTSTGFVSPKLRSMHNAEGCECHRLEDPEMRINHYLGSHGDHMTRLARYWKGYIANEQEAEERFRLRDDNDATSDTITHWSCATREILYRIASGLDLGTGF